MRGRTLLMSCSTLVDEAFSLSFEAGQAAHGDGTDIDFQAQTHLQLIGHALRLVRELLAAERIEPRPPGA